MTKQLLDTEAQKDAVAIIGAGLSGSLLALKLLQQGKSVILLERKQDPRNASGKEGRSINLGLSKRGITALKTVGLDQEVLSGSVKMAGRTIHMEDGRNHYQPYGKNNKEVLYSVDRHQLVCILLDAAEKFNNLTLLFNHDLTAIDKQQRQLTVCHKNQTKVLNPSWVVGADGAFSTTRRLMQRGERAFFQQEFLEWGYKELTLPASAAGESEIHLESLHVWPRSHCLIVSHPNLNNSHTLTLFLPFEGEDSFASLESDDKIHSFFQKYFSDLLPYMDELLQEWKEHPIGSLNTTKTDNWHYQDWIVLVGDACHAQYPFYGQGMNSAFEDCCLLTEAIEANKDDLGHAFAYYAEQRRPHTDALGELSKENFVELRKKVNSPWFNLKKKLDLALHKLFPDLWKPLYSMVAHTIMPYGDAKAAAKRQDKILTTALAGAGVAVSCFLVLNIWL